MAKQVKVPCHNCFGSRKVPDDKKGSLQSQPCPTCHGTGYGKR